MEMEIQNCAENQVNDVVNTIINANISDGTEAIIAGLRILRNLCTRGAEYQMAIASHPKLVNCFQHYIFDETMKTQQKPLNLVALQVLANSIVGNSAAQNVIVATHGSKLLNSCLRSPLDKSNDILLMILYNMFIGESGVPTEEEAFNVCVHFWQKVVEEKCEENFEFLHIFLEYFLVHNARTAVRFYAKLNVEERIAFLDYIGTYLRSDSPNGKLHTFLLQHISKEFKLKSDCVLRQVSELPNQFHPREVYKMLSIIAYATGSEDYCKLYANDHALFLNVSSLLRCLVAANKKPDGGGIPKPMTKLEEVALTSNISTEFEADVHFELKTLLVRCTANLLYENKTNKNYCLDTDLMPVLLECTVMDARNPLMKEWSILAIRNACIDCPEIQDVIAKLTNCGISENPILSELNLKMGSLRISSKNK